MAEFSFWRILESNNILILTELKFYSDFIPKSFNQFPSLMLARIDDSKEDLDFLTNMFH